MNNGICINVLSNTKKLNQQMKFELYLLDPTKLQDGEDNPVSFTEFAITDAEQENFNDYVNITTRELKKANVDGEKWNRIVSKGKNTNTGKVEEIVNYFYKEIDNKIYILKIRNNGRSLANTEVDEILDILSYEQNSIIFTLNMIDGTEEQIYISIKEYPLDKNLCDHKEEVRRDTIEYINSTKASELLTEVEFNKMYSTTIPTKAASMAGESRWYKYDLLIKDPDILKDYFFRPIERSQTLCTIYNTTTSKNRYCVTVTNDDRLLEESTIEDIIVFLFFLATGK